MTKVFIAGFKAGKNRYEMYIDSVTEETCLHLMDTEECIFRTNERGWVYNRHGALAGRFMKMDNGCYYYQSIDKSTRTNTKFKERIEAEKDAFSMLLSFGYKE